MYKARVLRFGKNLKSNQTLIWSYCNFETDYTTRLIGQVASARSEYSIFIFAVVCGFSVGKQSENKKFRFRFFSNPQKAFIFDWWHWHCFSLFLRNSSSLNILPGRMVVSCGQFRAINQTKNSLITMIAMLIEPNVFRWQRQGTEAKTKFIKTNISWIHNRRQINSQTDALCIRKPRYVRSTPSHSLSLSSDDFSSLFALCRDGNKNVLATDIHTCWTGSLLAALTFKYLYR